MDEKQKSNDMIDYALVFGLAIILLTICYMGISGKVVPELIQSILWTLITALGFKKALPVSGR